MNVLIIEDEQAAGRRLEKLLKEINPDVHVLDQIDSVEQSVQYLQQGHLPDLIFLDIQLADGSSFEIFEHIQVDCPVIFTTAYNEYALQAFKVNAVDYLLKPIKPAELKAALDKYTRNFQPSNLENLLETFRQQQGRQYLRRMLVRLGSSIRLVEMQDAAFFYTRDKITFMVSKSTGKRLPVDYPLDKLQTMLDPEHFFRINRQIIVNITSIREMHPYSKSRIKVDLEPATDLESIVSTERAAAFRKWLVGE
jgi:DNA-binding LytR/AlgR family response regulator